MKRDWTKDPDSVLDYQWDWTEWLDGDVISTATFFVASGITKDSETHDSTTATVWLSGGTEETEYDVTCRVTTANSRTADRTAKIWVVER